MQNVVQNEGTLLLACGRFFARRLNFGMRDVANSPVPRTDTPSGRPHVEWPSEAQRSLPPRDHGVLRSSRGAGEPPCRDARSSGCVRGCAGWRGCPKALNGRCPVLLLVRPVEAPPGCKSMFLGG